MFLDTFVFVQGVGLIGLLFVVLSFQWNKRSYILLSHMVAAFAFAIHFWFLGAWTAVAMQIFSVMRSLVFNAKETQKWLDRRVIMYLFILLLWAVGIIT